MMQQTKIMCLEEKRWLVPLLKYLLYPIYSHSRIHIHRNRPLIDIYARSLLSQRLPPTCMRMRRENCLKIYLRKFKRTASRMFNLLTWDYPKSSLDEDYEFVPKDVPEGHFVVYVGDSCKRYVVNLSLLNHPLFKFLLHLAQEQFGFDNNSKIVLPCHENVFLSIVEYADSSKRDLHLLFWFLSTLHGN